MSQQYDRDDGVFWMNRMGLLAGFMNRALGGYYPHERNTPVIYGHWQPGNLVKYQYAKTPNMAQFIRPIGYDIFPKGCRMATLISQNPYMVDCSRWRTGGTPHDCPGQVFWMVRGWVYDPEEEGWPLDPATHANNYTGAAASWGGGRVQTDGTLLGMDQDRLWLYDGGRQYNWFEYGSDVGYYRTKYDIYVYCFQAVLDQTASIDYWQSSFPSQGGIFRIRPWGYRGWPGQSPYTNWPGRWLNGAYSIASNDFVNFFRFTGTGGSNNSNAQIPS